MKINRNKSSAGYSLLELAIVLVIVGLLAGGTVVGVELIKSAEVKAAISEVEGYKIAIGNFNEQYEGLPGDLINATSFWTSGTANGNGNGRIGTNVITDDTEPYYVWDQLALSRFIPGVYSGAGTNGDLGVNSPESKAITGLGYGLWYAEMDTWGCCPSEAFTNAAGQFVKANQIVFGAEDADANVPYAAGLSPVQAYNIDAKIDDGLYNRGKVLGVDGVGSVADCAYDGSASANCVLYINIDN